MGEFMKEYFLIIIAIFLYRLITCIYRYFRIRILEKHFTAWYLEIRRNPNKDYVPLENKILRESQETIKYFKKAGLKDSYLSFVQAENFGYTSLGKYSFFKNYPNRDLKVLQIANNDFQKTIGVFKENIISCANPFWWLKNILFLPIIISENLELDKNKVITKLFQGIIYIIMGIAGFLFRIFRVDIETFVRQLIEQLF